MERLGEEPVGGCGCAAPVDVAATHCCCALSDLVHVIGRKYAMPIVNRIGHSRGAYFSDLQEGLAVGPSILADTLQNLERVGLVFRVVVPETPPRSEYILTPAGHALRARLRSLLDRVRHAE